jgi:hypothetical protein
MLLSMGWLLVVVPVGGVALVCAACDRRVRRHGSRVRDASRMYGDSRDTQRDVDAWEIGAPGSWSHDVSWMSHFRRDKSGRLG